MIYLIGLLIITGLLLLYISSRQRQSSGLPAGKIIYSDHKQWASVETALYDPTFNVTGKPDYIIESSDGPIPVEVKSGRVRNVPYDSHIYQLAAYCLLIDQVFNTRPTHGILHYSNKDMAVDYTPELESKTIHLIREIHSLSRKRSVDRSHESINRCQKCGYYSICDQSLG